MPDKKDDLFNLEEIKQILKLMKEYDVTSFNASQNGRRLVLRRAEPAQPPVYAVQSPVPIAPTPVLPSAPIAAPVEASATAPAAPDKDPDYVKLIKSPMVGIYFAASSPEREPFVQVGDLVNPKTTVCIIEAMKVFNDIPADVSGKVVEILVENGSPVEYGTPLFKIDTRS